MEMKIWTASAIGSYYRDPSIAFFRDSHRGGRRKSATGYYIVRHCDAEEGESRGCDSGADLGPFATSVAARDWSRSNLVEPVGRTGWALPRFQ